MRQLKGFILRQFERNQLTKEEGFDLLRELAEAELAQTTPATASPAPVASPVLPVSTTAPALTQGTVRGDIAIVGLSCRLPKARGPEQLWNNLVNGVDAVTPFPKERLEDVIRVKQELWQQYRELVESPERDQLRGGWLEDVDRFDAPFFDINPVDARTMGPAERLFLETAWEALEGAGYTREALRGSRTGVYLAHSPEIPFEYARLLPKEDPQSIPFNNPGATGYRLAYWLDLRGPTAVVNTTCSSSLASIHVACQSLRAGDCDMALAGGLSLFVFPFFHDTSDPMRLRSPDGRCKAFDASADGLSMGEGLGLVVLKTLEKARADGDFIHAVIKGSALNSDGRSNGLTAPNPAAQTDVLLRAWENAGIAPETLSYIEAHGAGTNLGDPIEVKGLTDAFRRHTDRKRFCALGSVKTNISHLGDAAGVAGLLKVVLGLQHRTLPASLHFKKANPLIPFEGSPLYVNAELKPWEPVQGVRRAGVSSFGISGTNCHVVLEEYVQEPRTAARPKAPAPCVLPISGRSLGALWRMLARYEAFLAEPSTEPLETLCHAAARFRDHHEYRVAIVGSTRDELRQKVGRLGQLRHLERLPESFAAQGIYAARVAGRHSEAYSEPPRGASGHEALVRAYLTEATVDWARHLPEQFDRVPLPTYAFDAIRFWPEHAVREAERYDDFFFDLRWVPKARPEMAPSPRKGVWLVLGDESPMCRELVERLRAAGSIPVVARADERFAVLSPTEYLVDPAAGGDYERLIEEVKRAHAQPLAGVLHLWTCQPPDDAMGSLEGITRSQDVSALSMYRLVHGLLKHGVGQDVELFIVSAYTQAVDGSEPTTVPARITTFGFSKVLSQEAPLVATCAIDVDVAQASAKDTAQFLFQELCVERTRRDELVAWRRGQRYTQTLEKMREQPELEHQPVRPGGVYVIAGGTGYLGIQVGKYLARQAKVKVVLLSRGKLPPRERWAELRRTEAPDSPLLYQLSGIAEMEALGSEVLCVPADVTDPLQLQDAIGRVRKRYGQINGVMVAMKQLYHKPIAQLTEDEFHTGLMNRVRGTWLLDSLTRQDKLDFFLLFSSISSIMGTKTASECCSVNQYLDAYAAYGRSLGRRVSVLNLTLILDDRRDFRGPTPIPPLDFREFLGCFEHFLKRQPPLAVVARFDRDEVDYLLPVLRIPFSDELLSSMGISRAARQLQALPAPVEAAPVAANPGEILETLRGVWKELLGQEPLDDEQSFFHAGGTSLTALKLVSLVRQKWGVKFEPADAYGHSTLAAMASYIAAQVSPKPVATQEDALARVLDGVEGGQLDVEAALSALRSRG